MHEASLADVSCEAERIPIQKIEEVKHHHFEFRALKSELDASIQKVVEELYTIRQKIRRNVRFMNRPNGLLTQPE